MTAIKNKVIFEREKHINGAFVALVAVAQGNMKSSDIKSIDTNRVYHCHDKVIERRNSDVKEGLRRMKGWRRKTCGQ